MAAASFTKPALSISLVLAASVGLCKQQSEVRPYAHPADTTGTVTRSEIKPETHQVLLVST